VNTSEQRFVEMVRACRVKNPAYTNICVWLINQVRSGQYLLPPVEEQPTKRLRLVP
jgi:hypothetical protein